MNKSNPRIMVAGIGGVGGLLAAMLIRRYGENVTLLARGARAEHLRNEGLELNGDFLGHFTVYPARVVENAESIEEQDLILVSVKNASLETIAGQFKGAVGKDTVIMPVMNGVTAADRVHEMFPEAHTMMSVIYTVSMVAEDNSIRQLGGYTNIFAGPVEDNKEERSLLSDCIDVITEAGIQIRESEDVKAACWSKYILNSSYNGLTAACDITIGDIKHSPQLLEEYREVMTEAYRVGLALGVNLPEDLIDQNMKKLQKTTDDSTSSLSRDFDRHVSGEYELFSKDISDMGRNAGVSTPHIDAMYRKMLERIASWNK